MEIESELYKQNPWWEGKFEENSIKRERYVEQIKNNLKSKEVVLLTGLRRVGKTTIIKQVIKDLIQNKANPQCILFVSLDSFALTEYSIHNIVEEYRKIHKKSVNDFFYLFLDEVSSKENFEQELKSLYDNDNIKIICSSSIAIP